MPNTYIVTLKKDTSPQEEQKIKDDIKAKGGSIGHEYTLIKGFSAEFPDDQVSTLESHPHVERMERDGTVTTQ